MARRSSRALARWAARLPVVPPGTGTDPDNPNAVIDGQHGALSGWEVHPILRWLLLAAAAAPFILIWIMIRDHELSWARGEMTAVAAIAALGLVVYTGFLDRPGEPASAISLQFGFFVALLGIDPDDRRRHAGSSADRANTQAPGGVWYDDRYPSTAISRSSSSA